MLQSAFADLKKRVFLDLEKKSISPSKRAVVWGFSTSSYLLPIGSSSKGQEDLTSKIRLMFIRS